MTDIDAIRERMRTNNWADVPNRDLYPQYYGRTYHWQTDGYLSDRSAQLYDCSAELQLRGAANIIRRLTIPYLAPVLFEKASYPSRVLEVACGTGRLLRQLHEVFPHVQLNGVDLSPFYIREASRFLEGSHAHVLRAADAVTLSDPDGTYDCIVSVFLLHELPGTLRRRLFANCYRMLRPGGRLVFVDSVQDVDDPFMGTYLRWILERFHEPYFPQYLAAPVELELSQLGFDLLSADSYFLGKYFVAQKPLG
jgi:ubiquinone/menaquinone biosynthesis C-methylase UbiE